MGLSDLVQVTFTTQNPGVTQAGFGVPLIASPNADFFGVARTRTYTSLTGVNADFGTATPEYMAAQKMFGQSTGLTKLMIGRCANKPTQQWDVGVFAATVNATYRLRVACANGSAWLSRTVSYQAVPAVAWAPSTVYADGALVANDTGPVKLYVCIAGGTSAGSGGPTGTGASITDGGVTWMYVGAGSAGATAGDAIVWNLKVLLDALATPALPTTNVLNGSVGSKTVRITATAAGTFIGLEVIDRTLLSATQDHADPGIAADLAAMALESTAWYGLVTIFNSSALVLAAAAWAESNTKLYFPALHDTAVATQANGTGSDVAQSLALAAYARTAPFFHPANDEFAAAAEVARWFPIDPGGDDWRLKTLIGVTAKTYTETETTNLEAKYCNYYTTFGSAPVVLGPGEVSANEYIDVVRFRDWFVATLQAAAANALINAEKIPFTDAGVAVFETIIKAVIQQGINAGGISTNPAPTVTAPLVANISTADKQARWLKGVTANFELAGAIHKLSVSVVASA